MQLRAFLTSRLGLIAIAVLTVGGAGSSTEANFLASLGQFGAGSGNTAFDWTNTGGAAPTATFNAHLGSVAVSFVVGDAPLNAFGAANTFAGDTILATMVITGSTNAAAVAGIYNPIDVVSSFSIIGAGNAGAKAVFNGVNLLSGTFTGTSILSGFVYNGGTNGGISVDDSKAGDTITFSTAIYDLTNVIQQSIAWTFSTITPPTAVAGNGAFSSFTTNLSGNFGVTVNQVVPEPATIVSLGACLLGLPVVALRRRRRSVSAA